jgi:hypothetical protein
MRQKPIRRRWRWLLGVAIFSGPILAGCGDSNQASGPAEKKGSPVLSTKDSMKAFFESRKTRSAKK